MCISGLLMQSTESSVGLEIIFLVEEKVSVKIKLDFVPPKLETMRDFIMHDDSFSCWNMSRRTRFLAAEMHHCSQSRFQGTFSITWQVLKGTVWKGLRLISVSRDNKCKCKFGSAVVTSGPFTFLQSICSDTEKQERRHLSHSLIIHPRRMGWILIWNSWSSFNCLSLL